MTGRRRTLAVLVAAWLVAACAAQPVSQATTGTDTAAPTGSAAAQASLPADSSVPGGSPAASAGAGSPGPVTGPPPKPGTPTFKLVKDTPASNGTSTERYRITWTSPAGAATKFSVYGLTTCPHYAKKYDGKPCVVKGMPIPKDKLKLLGTVPGDARTIDVTWLIGEAGPGPYPAILIRATNALGDSIFTIVHSDTVCYECVY